MQKTDAYQLRSKCAADHGLCFRYIVQFLYFLHFKLLTIFCGCAARFVSDLETPKTGILAFQLLRYALYLVNDFNEPCHEKTSSQTGLPDFQPGQAQSGLYSHRRWLED